jgi:hypothetical protein
MKKFGSWLAGVAGSIIVGVAVYYLTLRKPDPPPPTLPAPPAVTVFEGMVYSGSKPLQGAMVALKLSGTSLSTGAVHDFTDANGAYLFHFTGLPADATATLSATANGYQDSATQLLASPLQPDAHLDFPLIQVNPASPTGLGATVTQHPVMHIPLYVRKGAAQAVQIRIPQGQ